MKNSKSINSERKNVLWIMSMISMCVGILATIYVAIQVGCVPWIYQSLGITYVSLVIIPVAFAVFLRSGIAKWIVERRTVAAEELRGLYSEIGAYSESPENDKRRAQFAKKAAAEKKYLLQLKCPVFELDALPLRRSLVELYHPASELIAKARRELGLLNEYTSVGDSEEGEEWNRRINGISKKLEDAIEKGSDKDSTKISQLEINLRAELKILRETVAWYDKTWAIGEWTRDCVAYWISATVIVTLLAGILPIVHSEGDWNLTILHWGILGISGALLATVIQLHKLDLPELGETEGKQLFHRTVLSIAIGAATAVLLYAAIWGEALDGKIFPDLPTLPVDDVYTQLSNSALSDDGTPNTQWETLKNVGLSVFWGVFAGFSPGVFRNMARLAEISLVELKSRGG